MGFGYYMFLEVLADFKVKRVENYCFENEVIGR